MIFIDGSIGEPVVRALQKVRDDVIWLKDRYEARTIDAIWLRDAGINGWMVTTRDKNVRYKKAEISAIREYTVGCFVIGEKKDLSRWNLLKIIVTKMEGMEERFTQTEHPFIYLIDAAGEFCRVL